MGVSSWRMAGRCRITTSRRRAPCTWCCVCAEVDCVSDFGSAVSPCGSVLEKQECHHQTEQTHGLGQSKSQNSIREELLLERWVPGITNDQGSKDGSDSSS